MSYDLGILIVEAIDPFKIARAMQNRCLKCAFYQTTPFTDGLEIHGCTHADGFHTFIGTWVISTTPETRKVSIISGICCERF